MIKLRLGTVIEAYWNINIVILEKTNIGFRCRFHTIFTVFPATERGMDRSKLPSPEDDPWDRGRRGPAPGGKEQP